MHLYSVNDAPLYYCVNYRTAVTAARNADQNNENVLASSPEYTLRPPYGFVLIHDVHLLLLHWLRTGRTCVPVANIFSLSQVMGQALHWHSWARYLPGVLIKRRVVATLPVYEIRFSYKLVLISFMYIPLRHPISTLPAYILMV